MMIDPVRTREPGMALLGKDEKCGRNAYSCLSAVDWKALKQLLIMD